MDTMAMCSTDMPETACEAGLRIFYQQQKLAQVRDVAELTEKWGVDPQYVKIRENGTLEDLLTGKTYGRNWNTHTRLKPYWGPYWCTKRNGNRRAKKFMRRGGSTE